MTTSPHLLVEIIRRQALLRLYLPIESMLPGPHNCWKIGGVPHGFVPRVSKDVLIREPDLRNCAKACRAPQSKVRDDSFVAVSITLLLARHIRSRLVFPVTGVLRFPPSIFVPLNIALYVRPNFFGGCLARVSKKVIHPEKAVANRRACTRDGQIGSSLSFPYALACRDLRTCGSKREPKQDARTTGDDDHCPSGVGHVRLHGEVMPGQAIVVAAKVDKASNHPNNDHGNDRQQDGHADKDATEPLKLSIVHLLPQHQIPLISYHHRTAVAA